MFQKILAGSLQTLIPLSETNNHLVKAKSETSIGSSVASEPTRSKSLEIIVGMPMWSEEPTVIELTKGDRGLGFSILDYQVGKRSYNRGLLPRIMKIVYVYYVGILTLPQKDPSSFKNGMNLILVVHKKNLYPK